MGACILISMAKTAEEAMDLIRSKRKIARPQTWHIQRRIKNFEKVWQQRKRKSELPGKTYSDAINDMVFKLVWQLGVGREI